MNRSIFFDALRQSDMFGGSLTPDQIAGTEGILDAFVTHGDGRAKTLAYALATAFYETAYRLVPVRETLAQDDATARQRLKNAVYAQPEPPHGHSYYGRGQVQLTWKRNYQRSSADAGVDLVRYPDKALDPEIGARILVRGLLDGRWNPDGIGIAHFLLDMGPDDLKNARRTVNLHDRWELIAGYYKQFLEAIEAAGGVPRRPSTAPPLPSTGEGPGVFASVWTLISRFLGRTP